MPEDTSDLGNKRTVIIDKHGNADKATKIMPGAGQRQDADKLQTRPMGAGASGSAQNPALAATARQMPDLGAGEAANPNAAGGSPGGPATHVITPSLEPSVSDAAAKEDSQVAAKEASDGAEKGRKSASNPVVGWVVVVEGPGKGSFCSIHYGINSIGRDKSQNICLDFGDMTISAEDQAYIRYDLGDRRFLFVPNLAKTNIVTLNATRPLGAVPLEPLDEIAIGKTRLRFVPFCGTEFDWSTSSEDQ